MLLQVVLELEGLAALGALELAEVGALVVRDHVALQAVDVGERLAAHAAVLGGRRVQQGQVPVQRAPPRERLVAAGALEANRLPRVPGPRVVLEFGGARERLTAVHALEGVLLLRVDAVWGKKNIIFFYFITRERERNVLFNDTLNTFFITNERNEK